MEWIRVNASKLFVEYDGYPSWDLLSLDTQKGEAVIRRMDDVLTVSIADTKFSLAINADHLETPKMHGCPLCGQIITKQWREHYLIPREEKRMSKHQEESNKC